MSRYAQPMSQTLAQMQMNELKMNDPKLNKIFDKLKKGDKIKLKTSSTMSKGSDFVEYIVKSKNVVNKGRVEKITLATVGNEKAVKKFLYRRDGKVTFAMGDMAASIDDIKEKYSLINHEIVEEVEVEEKLKITKLGWEIKGARSVKNDLKIKEKFNFKQTAKDVLITSQLRTAMIANKKIKSANYDIDTYKKIIYVYGISQNEEERAEVINEAKEVLDVEDVVTSIFLVEDLRVVKN